MGLHIPAAAMTSAAGRHCDEGFERMADIAGTAEAAGFDSIWVSDRPGRAIAHRGATLQPSRPTPCSGHWLPVPGRPDLGALVTPVTTRNPAVLAKMVTTLDVLSGGRAVLGIGMGGAGDDGVTSVVVRPDQAGDDPGGQVGAAPPSASARGRARGPPGRGACSLPGHLHRRGTDFEGRCCSGCERADNRPRPVRVAVSRIMVDGEGDDDVSRARSHAIAMP